MSTNFRTDLAMERLEIEGNPHLSGIEQEEYEKEGIRVSSLRIQSEEASARLQKPVGTYVTVDVTPFRSVSVNFEGELSVVSEELAKLVPKEGTVLVAGLGNSDITPDAIGPQTAAGVLATRHFHGSETAKVLPDLRPVAVIAPGVLGKTGIETAEIIRSVCDFIRPSAVIAIDALASSHVDRLGCTVQISDTGISPGSGVQNKRKELSRETLGVPVVALGIPTVVDMGTIAENLSELELKEPAECTGYMVTPREIDVIIKQAAQTLSLAVNKALQPMLTLEEIMGLTQ